MNITGHCRQNFENKKFVVITQQYFALLRQVNFPDNNLNFQWSWRWWDQIQTIFLNLFYFTRTFWPCLLTRTADQSNFKGWKKCRWLYIWDSVYFVVVEHTGTQSCYGRNSDGWGFRSSRVVGFSPKIWRSFFVSSGV